MAQHSIAKKRKKWEEVTILIIMIVNSDCSDGKVYMPK